MKRDDIPEPVKIDTEDNDYETWAVGPVKIHVRYDSDPESPREWDNLWTLWSNSRSIGLDKSDGKWLSTEELLKGWDSEEFPTMESYLESEYPDMFFAPVWVYDHGGRAWSVGTRTGQFADRWDSAMGAIATCPKKKAREWLDKSIPEDRLEEEALKILESEISTLNSFESGEIYGYVVETTDGDYADSCWGFYDPDEAMREGLDTIKPEMLYDVIPEFQVVKDLNAAIKEKGLEINSYGFRFKASGETISLWCEVVALSNVSPLYREWVLTEKDLENLLGYEKVLFDGTSIKVFKKCLDSDDSND